MSLHWTTRALISIPIAVWFWIESVWGDRMDKEGVMISIIVTSGLIFWIIRPFIKPIQ